jgi:ABC-type branched-subunit amino acid transport system substrate-binding protein
MGLMRICRRLLLAAVLALLAPAAQAQQAGQPIRVGLLYSFSGAGAAGAQNYLAAARMAVKEINDAGGLLGRRLELVQADHAFDPARAVSEARRLTQLEKVDVVFGPEASALAVAVAPIFNEARTPYFSITVVLGPSPLNFSAVMSGTSQASAMLDFAANQLHAKTVALLIDNGSVGKQLVEDARKMAPAKSLQVVAIQEHEIHANDQTPQILALRRANPDVLIHSGSLPPDTVVLLKNLDELGWHPKIVSTVFGLAAGQIMANGAPDAFKSGNNWGLVMKGFTYCAGEKIGDRQYDRYLARLKAAEPANFDKMDRIASLYGTYEPIMTWRTAVEATKSLDGPTIVSWLEANAGKLRAAGTGQPIGITKVSHYMVGADAITFVQRPDLVRPEDKLVERNIDC